MVLLKKRKKGFETEDAGMIVYRIVILSLSIFIFVYFASMLLKPFPNINNAKVEVLTSRVLYSEAIHYKETIPLSHSSMVHTNIIDVDKLASLKYKQLINKLKTMTPDQITTFIKNPANQVYFENNTALEEYMQNQFYYPSTTMRNNLLVFQLQILIPNSPTQGNAMFPGIPEEYVLPINYVINSNNNIISPFNMSSGEPILSGFIDDNLKKISFESSNANDVRIIFENNVEQYIMMYPKKSSNGVGAVTSAEKKYKTSCKVFNKIVPCFVELSVLMPNS